jgi:hypothetical protein
MAVLLRTGSEQPASKVLAEAAKEYDISVDEISATVSKEFTERENAKAAKRCGANYATQVPSPGTTPESCFEGIPYSCNACRR